MGKILRMALLFMFLLMCSGIMAQNQGTVIKGTVTDDKGVTLPGVTVTVKGFQASAITDVNGNYSIQLPANGKILVFRFIGMETQEITVGAKTIVNVSLKLSSTQLAAVDVVGIGYGTQRRQDINGAISSVSAAQIQDIPQPSVDQMLQGKAAGVTVTQNSGAPGASVSVRVRGITSFNGSEPLYVIDGVAISGNANNGHQLTSAVSPSEQESSPSPLAQLNPNDIESIDVLKDASATAIYGSRGANGVVLITTKKGKNGSAKINYDFYYGLQSPTKFLKVMNLPQYAAYQNSLTTLFGGNIRSEFANPGALGPGTNWQDAIFSREPEQSHTLSFSGGKDATDYYISGGYFNQDGTILGSTFKRYSFHATVNSQVKDWFKVGTSFSANQSSENIGLGNSYGLIYNALLAAPDQAIYNADGSYAGPVIVNGQQQGGGRNAVEQAHDITNTLTRSNVQGSLYGDLNFTKDLSLHSEIDGNFDWSEAKTFQPTYAYGSNGQGGAVFANTVATLSEYNALDTYWNWVEHLNYNHTFGKHAVTALIGHEVWESNYDAINPSVSGFTAGNIVQTLNLASNATVPNEPKGSQSMESLIARIIYTYDNKYSITATDRSDRSSNFAQGHQTGYFPGVAVSWRLSQESFMAGINSVVSNLKIRLGYGTTGNSNIPQYAYGSSIKPVVSGIGTGFAFGNFSNPNLTWETAIQKNIGVDFSLFNSRIDASVDGYIKTSKNFLFQQPLPAFLSGGQAEFSTIAEVQPPFVNAGSIENKGIEVSITSHNIVSADFKWNTTLIFSKYNNKVLSLNGFPSLPGTVSTGFGPQITATRTQVGGPIGEFYGYKTEGIISTQAQLLFLAQHPQNVIGAAGGEVVSSDRTLSNGIYLGDILYAGNNNGAPNTQYALGNPNPDFTYSITNNFSYKDFDLAVFLTGSYGGKILNALDFQLLGGYQFYQNSLVTQANYWTPSNTNTNIPTPRVGFGNNNLVMSDRFLESASYLRLQNVRLGYNLPAKWARYVKLNHLKAFVSGQNLYVFTKYSGLDPEVGSLNQNPLLQNVDYGRYPNPRVITFGLNAEF